MLRAVAQSAVRQGWRYADRTLFPPGDGEPVVLPDSLQWKAQKRALTKLASQGLETVRPSYEAPPAAGRAQGVQAGEAKTDHDELLARLKPKVRSDATGNGRWTLVQARAMLSDGYPLDQVIERTGWGRMWLADAADRLANG